jgi:Tfp pilus assembly protein PilF
MGQFTPSGTLVSGKKISLSDKPAGGYLLTISVNRDGTSQKAGITVPFQISGDVPVAEPWDVDEPEMDTDEAKGISDQQRALCYLEEGNPDQARLWFRLALSKDHADDVARTQLVQAYYGLSAYSAVVSLFNDAGITEHTDPSTVSRIAESFLRTGNTQKAVSLLQDAVHSTPTDGTLYLALADCYQKMGKADQALEMSRKGTSLLAGDQVAK